MNLNLPQIEKLAPRFHVCKMTYTIFQNGRGERESPRGYEDRRRIESEIVRSCNEIYKFRR